MMAKYPCHNCAIKDKIKTASVKKKVRKNSATSQVQEIMKWSGI